MTETLTYAYLGGLEKRKDDEGFTHIRGLATDETLDLDGQICDSKWAAGEMSSWFNSGANMRAMHQPIAAGKAFELGAQGSGYYVDAKIVDADSALKVNEGIYTGLSVGIKGARVDKSPEALKRAPNGIIVGGKIIEVSLVDRPANPSCQMSLVKAAGIDVEKLDVVTDGLVPCASCNGTGKMGTDATVCEDCKGTGEAEVDIRPSDNGGDNEGGQVGDKSVLTDYFGYSDEDKAAWTPWQKGLMPDSFKKDYSDKDRKQMASNGQALPGGGFPIKTVQDLKNAIQAIGRAKDPAAAKAHIKARAKALGQEDLIPDTWKSPVAGLVKSLEAMLTKKADADTWTHDPAEIQSVTDGISNLLIAEIQEQMAGENEMYDISQLSDALSTVLSWRQGEANEGETTSPFNQGDSMSFVGLGLTPELVKAVSAQDATPEQKTEFKAELRKALGLEEEHEASIELLKKVTGLESDMETVKKYAAPVNISKRAMQYTSQKAAEVEKLVAQADSLKASGEAWTDPTTRQQYKAEELRVRAEAEDLRKSLEGD